jgi:hypothetical protein
VGTPSRCFGDFAAAACYSRLAFVPTVPGRPSVAGGAQDTRDSVEVAGAGAEGVSGHQKQKTGARCSMFVGLFVARAPGIVWGIQKFVDAPQQLIFSRTTRATYLSLSLSYI